jgi:hypothetical protein
MERNRGQRASGLVRQTDIEPYTGLKWVSRLFKAASIFLFVAMVGELIAGLRYDGVRSMPVLLGEAARTFVVAVVLWAGGDLVRLLVHLGHDIRAERILLARLVNRMPAPEPEEVTEPGPAAGIAREGEGLTLEERGAAD